ncbi:thioredoxin domain-containing protein [Rheinheimera baltica]|uniref:Thioredoxin domain-containing protein n=1 Tax=Rheinheimera baltica TaxID=67576 RepID=A0ABT9HUY2_9GAMM|nr:thioredoxin domain-containing protein [Rheinheimera baltica]MDP5134937.1 thioredoxin domain-containing protein [Rheinheimera baltica]MDP5149812.1 thioredoxin domain-containing protein [Rheinheimera baltica]
MLNKLSFALCALSFSLIAEPVSTEQELAALKAEVAQLKEIQRVMARTVGLGELVRPESLIIQGAELIGSESAKYVLMEFTDLHCPYCAKYNTEVYPEIKQTYVDKGELLYASYDFPLLKLHPNAGYAALMKRCAGIQGKYSEAKDELFRSAAAFDEPYIKTFPVEMGLDVEKFDACLEDSATHSKIASSIQYAEMLGFKSTPVFVLGLRKENTVVDYKIVNGVLTVERLKALMQELN